MLLTVEFEEGINYIREQVARSTNDEVQINWEETSYYWPMIKAEGEKLVYTQRNLLKYNIKYIMF